MPTDPWHPESGIRDDNPLNKVPALILDSGQVLFDSPVIAEYLDAQHGGTRMFPPEGPARWTALRLQALEQPAPLTAQTSCSTPLDSIIFLRLG